MAEIGIEVEPLHICKICGREYSIDDFFASNAHYFEHPYNYSHGSEDHCLACWLGVGPLDMLDEDRDIPASSGSVVSVSLGGPMVSEDMAPTPLARQIQESAGWLFTILALILPMNQADETIGDLTERWPELCERHGTRIAWWIVIRNGLSIVFLVLWADLKGVLDQCRELIEKLGYVKHGIFIFALGAVALSLLPDLSALIRLGFALLNAVVMKLLLLLR